MLSSIAIVPSAPVMVPELAGAASAELADLDDAVTAAVAALPARWVAVGVGPTDEVVAPPATGTFAGYGVDVRIALSGDDDVPPTDQPLCVLVAGWLRGRVNPDGRCEVRVCDRSLDVESALTLGRRLRAEIDAAAEPVGVLIVADGLTTLTPPAPGGYDPDSVVIQDRLADALSDGDVTALADLPAEVVGRVAYQVLAGLAGQSPRTADALYRAAPYGVGYVVGVWHV